MQKLLRSAFILLMAGIFASCPLYAQLTLHVTSIPINTPPGASIYAVGTFNNWDPGDATMILTPGGSGQYSITVNPPAGQVKFKFKRRIIVHLAQSGRIARRSGAI